MASLKSCKEVFAFFDAEKKGYLTKHQLKCSYIYLTGEKPTYSFLKSLIARYGREIDYS